MKKILVVRFSSIGDIVLTTPVLRGLHQQIGAEIHYLTKPQYAPLLVANPYLARIHLLEGSIFSLARQLRSEGFDYLIDLHHNLRTRVLKSILRIPSSSFYKMNLEKWMYVHFKWPPLPREHIVDRYWRAVSSLGVRPDSKGLDYFIPPESCIGAEVLPSSFQSGYVAYAIGGRWATKKLPLQQMISLCDKINRPVLLLGGPEDRAQGEAVSDFFSPPTQDQYFEGLKALGKKTEVYNGCGRFSVHESASLLRSADYVFTHDTGMMHVAAAFGKKIFCIWGSTVPELGMYPYRTRFTVLQKQGLRCRPCSKIGHNKCPRSHFRCMREIPLEFTLE